MVKRLSSPWHQRSCLPLEHPPQFPPPWSFGMGKMPSFLPGEERSRKLKMSWSCNQKALLSYTHVHVCQARQRAVKMIPNCSFYSLKAGSWQENKTTYFLPFWKCVGCLGLHLLGLRSLCFLGSLILLPLLCWTYRTTSQPLGTFPVPPPMFPHWSPYLEA